MFCLSEVPIERSVWMAVFRPWKKSSGSFFEKILAFRFSGEENSSIIQSLDSGIRSPSIELSINKIINTSLYTHNSPSYQQLQQLQSINYLGSRVDCVEQGIKNVLNMTLPYEVSCCLFHYLLMPLKDNDEVASFIFL